MGGPMTEPMTEPKRWTYRPAYSRSQFEVVAAADFDRLRDERDEILASAGKTIAAAQQNVDDARRVAGVLADALRNNAPCYCDHPLRAGLPPCSRCSALAVFDTLTEEKP